MNPNPHTSAKRWHGWLGLAWILAYALPLFFPPSPTFPLPPGPESDLWQRLFPGVPTLWVLARVLCLVIGACWIGANSLLFDDGAEDIADSEPSTTISPGHRGMAWFALALATLHALSGFYVAEFSRAAETIYFFFLGVPALVLLVSDASIRLDLRLTRLLPLAVLCVIPVSWFVYAVGSGLHSPRAASVVDMWLIVERLSDAVTTKQAVLSTSAIPGLTNAYMILEGIFLLGDGKVPLTFAYIQLVHIAWTAICGVGMGLLALRYLGTAVAIVVQAVFLFSPLVLSLPYNPGGVYIMPLCTLALLLLLVCVDEGGSAAAFAAFGAVAGFSGRVPQLTFVTVVVCGLMLLSLRRRHVDRVVLAVSAMSALAAVIPGFPDLRTLSATTSQFTFGAGQMSGIETTFFGQQSALAIEAALSAGHPGPFDIPLGAVLAPFAITRTPMRLLGDVLFDPIGSGLIAIGMASALLGKGRRRWAPLFALWIAGSIVGMTSSGDTVSHTRLAPTLIPLCLFAGIGFTRLLAILRLEGARPPAAVGMTVVLAVSGLTIFHLVNPRILPASWQAVAFEALGEPANAEATFFDYGFDCLHVGRMASLLPTRPQRAFNYCEFEFANTDAREMRLHIWNPALETDAEVSCEVCQHWPEAAIYTLEDPTGLYRTFVASPQGANWTPQLPKERWSVRRCRTQSTGELKPSFCYTGTSAPKRTSWPEPAMIDRLSCATDAAGQS